MQEDLAFNFFSPGLIYICIISTTRRRSNKWNSNNVQCFHFSFIATSCLHISVCHIWNSFAVHLFANGFCLSVFYCLLTLDKCVATAKTFFFIATTHRTQRELSGKIPWLVWSDQTLVINYRSFYRICGKVDNVSLSTTAILISRFI